MAEISWILENIVRGVYVLVMSFYVYSFVPSYPVSAAYHSVPDYLACEVGEVALWLGGRSGVGEEAKRQASEVTCETVKTIRSYKNFGRTSAKVGDILEKERVLINLAAFRRAAPQ